MPDDATVTEAPGLPPLRIHHFFAWSVVAAAALTVSSLTARGTESQLNEPGAYRIMGITTGSAAVVALAVVLFWGFGAVRRVWQPGHGLLALFTLGFVYGELFRLVAALSATYAWQSWYEGASLAFSLVYFAVGVACAVMVGDARIWFWLLMLLGVAPIGWVLSLSVFRNAMPQSQVELLTIAVIALPYLPCGVLVVLAMLRDRRAGVRWHWTHWCGVALLWAHIALYFLVTAFYGIQVL